MRHPIDLELAVMRQAEIRKDQRKRAWASRIARQNRRSDDRDHRALGLRLSLAG